MTPQRRDEPSRACKGPPVDLETEHGPELDAELEAELEAELDTELEAELDAELEAECGEDEQWNRSQNNDLLAASDAILAIYGLPPSTTDAAPPRLNYLERLWRELPPDMVDSVLSHLPVATLWDTVMAIDSARWTHILSDGRILEHGSHVDSSIGFIKTHSSFNLWPRGPELDRRPPSRALEHTTQTWQTLPAYPECPPESRYHCSVQSVSEGVILLTLPDLQSGKKHGRQFRHLMAVWNPVSHSHRWLPTSPLNQPPYNANRVRSQVVVVDRERRGYKVMEFSRDQAGALSHYAVYDSESAAWDAVHPPPRTSTGDVKLHRDTKSVVSCEGCVCFVTAEQRTRDTIVEMAIGIVCYNPATDVWSAASFPSNLFQELRRTPSGSLLPSGWPLDLLYAAGKLYLTFLRYDGAGLHHDIASTALVDLQSGVAAFERVGRVTEAATAPNGCRPLAPERCSSRPEELILRRFCGPQRRNRFYMLPVGSTWYLCVVAYGRWHKRFDLNAGIWTEFLMKVPFEDDSDPDLCVDFHSYIPSWIRV